MSLSVAVAGASGYAGGELLRLLAQHPELEVRTVTAHANAGQPLVSVHPHLRSLASLTFQETTASVLAGHDVVFLALPHGHSGGIAAQLPESTLVVDAGADHRLLDPGDWQAFYGSEHSGTWPYGMPELILADGGRQRRELRAARRIAVPGCNATAVTLAIAPGISAGLIDPTGLTSRELEVLKLIAQGRTNQQIAEELVIEVGTVKNHVHNILDKLNVSSRGEAAAYLAFIKK